MMIQNVILQTLLFTGIILTLTEARIDDESHTNRYHHHFKDQAPTDATFRHRYHALMHSHSPFGVLSKYFIRNRAQEHREKRQSTTNNQQTSAMPRIQSMRHYRRVRQPQQSYSSYSASKPIYPRYLYPYPNYSNVITPRQSYVQQGSFTRNNKLTSGSGVVPTYNIYGKPQTLGSYYRQNAEYQNKNIARRQPGFGSRQDNSNSRKTNHQNVNTSRNSLIKRRFKPSLLQA